MAERIRCNKCGFVGDKEDFRWGRDFLQNRYVAACSQCNNRQTPGNASMRMFGGERPFEFVREGLPKGASAVEQVMRNADEAS